MSAARVVLRAGAVAVAVVVAASLLCAAASPRALAQIEPLRPQIHFSPARHWINDPNGLVYFEGEYHLFFQYNPQGEVWGHMSWGHAVSADLVHWRELPVAIPEDDRYMIFSGSIVVDTQNSSGFARNGVPVLVAIYTGAQQPGSAEQPGNGRQSQQLAYSADRGRTWTKYAGNPVLDLQLDSFRDPKVFWYPPTQRWVMAAVLADRHQVALFSSADLKHWVHSSDFGPAGATDGAWECPDLFALRIDDDPTNVRWILKVDVFRSALAGGAGAQYFTGRFDGHGFTADVDPTKPAAGAMPHWIDYGMDFYAAASWGNLPDRGRAVWIAWMNNHAYAQEIPTSGWRGAMSLPRQLKLHDAGGVLTLRQQPVPELQSLRAAHLSFGARELGSEPFRLDVPRGGSGAVELVADLEAGSAKEFGLKVHVGAAPSGAAQETRIGYEPAKSRLFVDRARSGQIPAPIFAQRRFAPVALAQGRIHLHVFVDASSVEVFANEGEVVFTSQVFPDPHSNGIEFYAEGGHARLENLQLWALKSALPAMTPPSAASTAAAPMASAPWWQHAVIYEIYPRSFQDSDGDGVGDLNGITSRLDYLRELGVDAVWLAPVYPSPQVDFGYDISAYTAIDPQYGTLADLDRLIAEAGKRHIRVLMDMVLNHTSDQHRWFQESMRSRTNDKADWFVWNDGIPADTPGTTPFQQRFAHDGRVPPNNWESLFGGSAWEWVPARAQFYYHRFYRQQPDLNWNNPAVETAMFDVMRFWLDRGVAGFRLDAITSIFEDPALRDEPLLGGVNDQGDPALDHIYTEGLATDALLRRMRTLVDSYPGNRVLIGETYVSTTAELDRLYGGASKDELQLPMDMLPGLKVNAKLTAPYQRRYLEEAQAQLHGSQPLLVYDNHDNARSIDRFGDGVHDVAIAKLLAALLNTTRATALTYYGAEIGMRTTPPTRREDVKDPIGITGWPAQKGRDGERTPMQWTPGAQAGFSTNPHTWLPIPPSHREVNVETERADPDSLLNWTRRIIALRRGNAAIRDGAMRMLDPDDAHVLIYARAASASDQAVIVALNMSDQPRLVNLEVQGGIVGARPIAARHPPATGSARTLLSTDPSLHGEIALAGLELAPYAVWIAAVHR